MINDDSGFLSTLYHALRTHRRRRVIRLVQDAGCTVLSVADEELSDAQQVLDVFQETETSLRVDDVIERVDLPLRRVVHAVEKLIAIGAIVEIPSGARYQRITMQSSGTTHRHHG